MSAKLENSVGTTGLETVSFHFNPKERQYQRMFKLPYNWAYFTCEQGYAQNPSNWASVIHDFRTFRVQAGFRKGRGTRDQISNICWITEKAREFQKSIYIFFTDYTKAFDCMDHSKLWKILKEIWYFMAHRPKTSTRQTYLSPKKPIIWVKKQ